MTNKLETYENGILISAIPYTQEELLERVRATALKEIERLEAQITPRRIREAFLGNDGGWLANQESLIFLERTKLG